MPLRRERDSKPVSELRNLGPKSALVLMECGIRTIDELAEIGAVKAYVRAKALRPKSVSLNLLWALAAGLEDRDWRELSAAEKARLTRRAAAFRRSFVTPVE